MILPMSFLLGSRSRLAPPWTYEDKAYGIIVNMIFKI